jgi:hypothetical protein
VSALNTQGNSVGQNGGAGFQVNNLIAISICGNHLEGNGGDVANSAQIAFSGTLDGINLCGNTYRSRLAATRAQRLVAAA